MLLSFVLFSHTLVAQKVLTTKVTDKGIQIDFNGKTRFVGGKPQIENQVNLLKTVVPQSDAFTFRYDQSPDIRVTFTRKGGNIFGLKLSLPTGTKHSGKEFAGFFFDELSGYKTGVEIWRYKPWNSWTKPVRVSSPGELHDWDVQFFYWQYADGLYGAAIPLSGNGYRTTLGEENGKMGCKSLSYTEDASVNEIPMMLIGLGDDPYKLFEDVYREGLKMMGKAENLRSKKVYPEPLEYVGWCTWNSSQMGQNLDEQHLLEGTATFTNQKFPLGWLLIDDGWFDQDGSRLNAFTPNPKKFPNGFKSLTSKLRTDYGLKHVGIWHAYNGYWNGINPDSELGRRYSNELFSWKQKESVGQENSRTVTYHFIKPESDSLAAFYDQWHHYMSDQGFSFIKVDNQLVSERMSVDTYPIGLIAENMHNSLYASAFKYFDGAIINCMDMTNEAFYNFGKSAVARTVEDYFPERDGGVGYNLEKGGAAAHVLMALYNSLYFSQMVWTDFDMFESNNTYATFHAAARAISGGPVYVTDMPGQQHFDVLWPLIDSDGKIIRADKPASITEDCLFQLQDKKPLKAFTFAGKSGLMAVFNAADANQVEGVISPSDIRGLAGQSFAVYEFFSKELTTLKREEQKEIKLDRMGCNYFNFVPIHQGVALIGLVNKYNAPKTILASKIEKHNIEVKLRDGGEFKALLPSQPLSVSVNGLPVKEYTYQKGVFTLLVKSDASKQTVVTIGL